MCATTFSAAITAKGHRGSTALLQLSVCCANSHDPLVLDGRAILSAPRMHPHPSSLGLFRLCSPLLLSGIVAPMTKMKSMQKDGPGLSRQHSTVAYFVSNSIGYSMAISLDIVGGEGEDREGGGSDK